VCWLHVFKGVVAGRSVGVGVLEPCVCVACGGVNRCDSEWHWFEVFEVS